MNSLELRFFYDGPSGIGFNLMVDSVRFGEANVDFEALLKSCHQPGGYFILTCGFDCVPECAGFWDPIFVSHKDGVVRWEFETRYYPTPSQTENPDSKIVRLEFPLYAYVNEIVSKLRKWHTDAAFSSLGNFHFSPADFEVSAWPPPTDPRGGLNIHFGYQGELRNPWWITEPEIACRMPDMLPNCELYRLFNDWACLFEDDFLLDESGEYVDSLPMKIKPGVLPEDCNRAALAIATQLAEELNGRSKVSWERILFASPWETERVAVNLCTSGQTD